MALRRINIAAPFRAAAVLLLCSAARPGAALVAQSATIRGRVTEVITSRTIPAAIVLVTGPAGVLVDTADAAGLYEFRALTAATYQVRVEATSYAPAELRVLLSEGSVVTVDITLARVAGPAVTLRRVVVRTRRTGPCCAAQAVDSAAATGSDDRRAPWRASVGADHRAHGSLAQSGALASAERSAPGFDRIQPAHSLFVWGAEDEQGRVLVDGAPLDVPLQVAGLLPPLDPNMLVRTAVRTGGATPRFDGGTAYIVDMTTRTPQRDTLRSWGEVDALAIRSGFETALGGGAIAASVRRVNGELAQHLIGPAFGYASADGIVRGDWPTRVGRLRATGIGSSETVVIPRDQATDRAVWQNTAGVLAWDRGAGRRISTVTITAGRGAVSLPVLTVATGHLRTTADRLTATANGESQRGAWRTTGGASVEYLRVSASAPPAPSDTLRCMASLGCWSSASVTASAFAEWSRRLGTRFHVSGGTRVNGDLSSGNVHILPRASVTIDLGQGVTAGVSAGRYSQVIADLVYAPRLRASVPSLRPVHASQLEAGLQWQGVQSRLTGVVAVRTQEMPSVRHATVVSTADFGWSWTTTRAEGSLVYGGAYSSAQTEPSGAANRTRHVATGRIAFPVGRVTAELTAAYSAGLPFTSIVLERPSAPVPVLGGEEGQSAALAPPTGQRLRVDAAVRTRWRVGSAARALTLEPYAAVLNVLNRHDAVFYYRSASDPLHPRALAALPLFATVGIRWSAALPGRDRQR